MHADRTLPAGLAAQVDEALARLERHAGKRLGDPDDPLLVSVRSGARDSMPGMLDTVLNLGLNDRSVQGLAARTQNERFAWDSYRRFVQMFGNVVRGVEGERFEDAIKAAKARRGVEDDTDLDAAALRELTETFRGFFDFPQEPRDQLEQSIRAVFDSWEGERAVAYRRINRIPDAWGTAVNVQQMVFGNKGATSGSGVVFSRDEVAGAPEPSGDFLPNAQGEDVVSGVRTRATSASSPDGCPTSSGPSWTSCARWRRTTRTCRTRSSRWRRGASTCSRPATPSARRRPRCGSRSTPWARACSHERRRCATIEAEKLEALLHPTFDPQAEVSIMASGVAASPGAAKGGIAFTAHEAVAAAEDGRDVILVRPFTEANDVAGFHAAKGVLTSEGGKASHAALVARGMGVPAVTGAGEVHVDLVQRCVRIGDLVLHEGDLLAIDGTTGSVTTDDVPLVEPEITAEFRTVLGWADELRRLGVRTNADTPEDATRARELGAEGIGLCRTEHMFFGDDRHEKVVRVILADDDEERRAGLDALLPLQQGDFEAILEAMDGLPVTIRLLDPPLHEFLPHPADLPEGSPERARVEALQETNPMLGTRGVRLGILHPQIYEMQILAVLRALKAVRERTGGRPQVEIMIPLVDYERELELLVELVDRVADREGLSHPGDFLVGTMLELPRACLQGDRIAEHADFFSFGTNDLTQTALGFSRDDIEGRILARYINLQIFDRSPFETLDIPGVGQLVRMGGWLGRTARPDLKLGVCGEHGGDPDSIAFFHVNGIDYVSCSPYRVPIARIAAAQAAVAARG